MNIGNQQPPTERRNDSEEVVSYAELDGEWRRKKVSVVGVVKSFLGQLRTGQDMTSIRMPAVLFFPFSLLETIGHRELNYFDDILALNREESPKERMLVVLRWFIKGLHEEDFPKKPYNPVLGEVHEGWQESKVYGRNHFFAEQVAHHPPVSAYYICNKQEGIMLLTNLQFSIQFCGNYVRVNSAGFAKINVPRRQETYVMSRRFPGLSIKNIVLGIRKMVWEGDLTISCKETGYSATVSFVDKTTKNSIKAVITHNGLPVAHLRGRVGGHIKISEGKEKKSHWNSFMDASKLQNELSHTHPKSKLPPQSSTRIWEKVNHAILEENMEKADEYKRQIEDQQKKNTSTPKYFVKVHNEWVPNSEPQSH